jgi:hypothetical protein
MPARHVAQASRLRPTVVVRLRTQRAGRVMAAAINNGYAMLRADRRDGFGAMNSLRFFACPRVRAKAHVRDPATNGPYPRRPHATVRFQEGVGTMSNQMPADTWIVVETAQDGWEVVSTHADQPAGERECDDHNGGLARRRFSAVVAIEPIAARMGRACG